MFVPAVPTKDSVPGRFGAPFLLGVEQEFDIATGEGKIDFRGSFKKVLAHTRSIPFRNCDSAVILDAGYMLACDGPEAEFATAPIRADGDGCLSLAREATRCRMHMLHSFTRIGVRQVRGYSTHFNISVPIGRETELAWAISRTVAPALILLMEARNSPGLLIRPRRGRLEIGSEYMDDEKQMAAAIVFLTGVTRAYLGDESLWNQFPRVRLHKWEEANIRPGIFLPPDAYGESLHERGRSALLTLETGGKITAGKVLEVCAGLVLRGLDGTISMRAGNVLRNVVRNIGSLQIERRNDPGVIHSRSSHSPAVEAKTLKVLTSISDRTAMTPVFVDWHGVAFAWERSNVPLILGIPWISLPQFFTAAHRNGIPGYVASLEPAQAALTSLDQLRSPQVFQQVDPVSLGSQALNDKGMHGSVKGGGSKGGSSKPHQQIERVELAQTMISRRPPPVLPQTLISRRPIPQQGRKGNWGWLIGLVIALVIGLLVITGLMVGIGLLTRSHKTSPNPPPVNSSVPLLPLNIITPTPVPTPTLACVPGPIMSFPSIGMILNTGSILLQWHYPVALEGGQVFAVLVSGDPNNLQGPNSNRSIVGTTTSQSLRINLPQSRNSGNAAKFYWLVRIKGADGQFVDCPAAPIYFEVRIIRIPPTRKALPTSTRFPFSHGP